MKASIIQTPEHNERVLWVRHSTPFLLRCVLLPLGLLFVGFALLAAISPAVNFDSRTAAWIGTISLLFFGLMFIQAALFRGDIRFDPTTRDLIFTSGGLFRSRQCISTDSATAIELY